MQVVIFTAHQEIDTQKKILKITAGPTAVAIAIRLREARPSLTFY